MLNLNDVWDHLKAPDAAGKLEKLGDVLQYVLPWLALFLSIFYAPSSVPAGLLQITAAFWAGASLLIVGIASVVKALSNFTRFGVRPNGGKNSFPSGHTAGAFIGPTYLHFLFGFDILVALMYGLAMLTGVSRVVAKKHWWRDVIGGALLSTSLMYFLIKVF